MKKIFYLFILLPLISFGQINEESYLFLYKKNTNISSTKDPNNTYELFKNDKLESEILKNKLLSFN